MFSTLYDAYFAFQMHFKMSSVIRSDLDQYKILSSGNELIEIGLKLLKNSANNKVRDEHMDSYIAPKLSVCVCGGGGGGGGRKGGLMIHINKFI